MSSTRLASLKAKLPTLMVKDDEEDEFNDEENEEEEESEEESEEEEESSVKKIDPGASFFTTFIDGSSFRYLVEYLRLSSLEGTFVFTKDAITYQKEDDDKTIFNDVKLRTYELIDYEFSSQNSEITATVNLSDLRNKTRTVGKKEQMDIYRRPEEPTNFYIQVRSQEKSSGDNPIFYCMPMRSESVTIYELPEYERGKNDPNCTIYQTDFSKLCKSLVANKCNYVEIVGYERGIIIKGYSSDDKIIMVKEYGKCKLSSSSLTSSTKSINLIRPQSNLKLNIRDADEVERFKIPIANIKALSKINGFSNSCTIKIYIQAGAPMKLTVPIGSYGELKVLLRSCS
tara:strand:+ start:112 stop:1140 length:1029 start_codon:yes stop_codon:yes gene_type:complete